MLRSASESGWEAGLLEVNVGMHFSQKKRSWKLFQIMKHKQISHKAIFISILAIIDQCEDTAFLNISSVLQVKITPLHLR